MTSTQQVASQHSPRFDAVLCWVAKDGAAVSALAEIVNCLLAGLDEELSSSARDRLGQLGQRQNGIVCVGPGDYVAGLALLKAAQVCSITIVDDRDRLITDRRTMREEFLNRGIMPAEFDRVVDKFGLRPQLIKPASGIASRFF